MLLRRHHKTNAPSKVEEKKEQAQPVTQGVVPVSTSKPKTVRKKRVNKDADAS